MKPTAIAIYAILSVARCERTAVPSPTLSPEDDPSRYNQRPLVLVVAFDGLRYDAINQVNMPHLHRFATKSLWTDQGIKSVFPSSTLPNFYSIATGLYAESHGIIYTDFYDPDFDEYYDWFNFGKNDTVMKGSLDGKWYKGTPLWLLNEMAGGRSGCLFYPTCDAEIGGRKPTFATHFDGVYGDLKVWSENLDTILSWFTHDETPINLGFYYIGEPDLVQHFNNIKGQKVYNKIKEIDRFVGHLLRRVRASPVLSSRLNLVFLGDHGHANVYYPRDYIYLNSAISETDWACLKQNAYSYMSKPNCNLDLNDIYKAVKFGQSYYKWKAAVYLKSELPERYHWSNNSRIGELIIVPDIGQAVAYAPSVETLPVSGSHGYDPDYKQMRSFFIASGPAFANNCKLPIFENVDIYPALAKVLGLTPAENNGTIATFEPYLIASGFRITSAANIASFVCVVVISSTRF